MVLSLLCNSFEYIYIKGRLCSHNSLPGLVRRGHFRVKSNLTSPYLQDLMPVDKEKVEKVDEWLKSHSDTWCYVFVTQKSECPPRTFRITYTGLRHQGYLVHCNIFGYKNVSRKKYYCLAVKYLDGLHSFWLI